MRLVIVTGMSGAGKSTAMKMMEDMGFFCIDNLPIPLLDKLVDFTKSFDTQQKKIAIGIDARSGKSLDSLNTVLDELSKKDIKYEILFLDAEDNVLVKRYKETRRSHPLAHGERVDKGIRRERCKLEYLKEKADYIIDTSRLLTRELKTELERIFVKDEEFNSLYVTILSFGFKYGIPADSDIVMDVRFLPNPYYVDGLRPKTGNDVEIQQYVMQERCRHAANLLKYSKYPISIIAEYFCFSSQSHFGRQFRLYYGMTPNEYRRQNQAGRQYTPED